MRRTSAESWKRAAAAALCLLFAVLLPGCASAPAQPLAQRYLVAAAHPLAVEAGYSVLKEGGSAVDAAIAVQMVLGLVEPQSSGIGGGAFMLHWHEATGTLRAYDGREAAPAAARADRFLGPDRKPVDFLEAVVGGRSVGVPGVLRMLELAHSRHGKLPWPRLFRPAIRAAEEGFLMSPRLQAALEAERFLREDPEAQALYYEHDGAPKALGTRLVNPRYAATLRAVADRGADAFYEGDIARAIVHAVRSHARAGDLAEEDLAAYRALEREPLCGPYRAYRVCSMPPPSSGALAVLQILGILERAGFDRAPPHSTQAVHLFAEAGRLAYADRARYVGDPDVTPVPVKKLLAPRYLEARARLIGERSMRLALPGDSEAPGTSHLAIVDREGNVVSMTTTIESVFGARIMVRGFLLNNQLTDFDFVPGLPNEVGPGKRPRSSMAPTIVFEDGRVRLAVGSPGGPNIINYVAKTLVGVLDWGLGVQEAIALPNFGSRNGPTLIEEGTPYEALAPLLERRGHLVELAPLTSGLHGIERVSGGWRGGADPRREGAVRGE